MNKSEQDRRFVELSQAGLAQVSGGYDTPQPWIVVGTLPKAPPPIVVGPILHSPSTP